LQQGRSPYGPPLRDENGDLILGPHTHDDDASGYVQQFDDRGHPCSKETDIRNRRLRKAQNQVLKLAGVVRSQNDPPLHDEWKTLDNEGKHQLISEENEGLTWLTRPFHQVVLDLSTCWVDASRFRFMVWCIAHPATILIDHRHTHHILVRLSYLYSDRNGTVYHRRTCFAQALLSPSSHDSLDDGEA
jgi:hypothetical protein